jgi:uncharacterized repeat protein (TIGR03843 family)
VRAADRPAPLEDDAPRLLADGEIRVLGLLPRASNSTFLAEVTGAGERTLAVYKPEAGEAPLWDFPEGTLGRREVAAYVLSRALGWPSVPETILRDGPFGPGSLQRFVEVDPREHYFTLRERCLDDFRPVAAFDVVANNADRKSGHCLRSGDGRIWLVDHGVCFHPDPKLRTVIWEFAGEPLGEGLTAGLLRLAEDLRAGEARGRLLELLTPLEVDRTADRAERLATSGRFPHPRGERPYPWPPV